VRPVLSTARSKSCGFQSPTRRALSIFRKREEPLELEQTDHLSGHGPPPAVRRRPAQPRSPDHRHHVRRRRRDRPHRPRHDRDRPGSAAPSGSLSTRPATGRAWSTSAWAPTAGRTAGAAWSSGASTRSSRRAQPGGRDRGVELGRRRHPHGRTRARLEFEPGTGRTVNYAGLPARWWTTRGVRRPHGRRGTYWILRSPRLARSGRNLHGICFKPLSRDVDLQSGPW
jgi:hypothetical protein